MIKALQWILVFLINVLLIHLSTQQHIIKPLNAKQGETYVITVDNNTEYVLEYPKLKTKNPYRISTLCTSATVQFPILITVKEEQQVIAWQIPMKIKLTSDEMLTLGKTSRTLCYDQDEYDKKVLDNSFSVYVWTASEIPLNVTIQTTEVKDYYAHKKKNYTMSVSPSEPAFFYYPDKKEDTRLSNFIRILSSDEVCLVVSVQNSMCPVRDLNADITYQGRYQTVITKGGMFISKDEYPNGFFLVFVAKGDNSECNRNMMMPDAASNKTGNKNRTTIVSFVIEPTIQVQDYVKPIMTVFGLFILFCLLIIGGALLTYKFGNIRYYWTASESALLVNGGEELDGSSYHDQREPLQINDDGSDVPDKYYKIDQLSLIHLVKDEEKSNRKSFNFLWHIMNVGLFYGIPVVQLMVSYQKRVNSSGDEDICYHNFYCSRPYLGFTDFNHIYSNIGYILVGIVFLCVTLFRDKLIKHNPRRGIPKHYGLYYAMGIALILEGIMSGCYHICPSQMNFQFDTSFMYVMAILGMVKLYQNRHPDVNASAYGTFTVVGLIVFIAMLGILLNSKILIGIFIICYIGLCIYLSFKIYFFGEVLEGIAYYYNKFTGKSTVQQNEPVPFRKALFIPMLLVNIFNFIGCLVGAFLYPTVLNFGSFLLAIFMANLSLYIMFYITMKVKTNPMVQSCRFKLLLVSNFLNLIGAILGGILYPSWLDFASFLLVIFMGNFLLHCTFYIVMKCTNDENICWEARIYIVLVVLCWSFASLFFFNQAAKWDVAPAESKMLNNDCIFMDFYDQHDIWHLLSAPALIFAFLMLMCLDDDIFNKPQDAIIVF